MGWAQPWTIPMSMSSGEAKPDSIIRIAERRYGIRRALTMKPARSWERITFLPSVSAAKASTRAAVSSLVSSEGTTSTRASTGTGLKKCRPTTLPGRWVAMASFMIGIDEVFEARTASSASTASSRARKTETFTSSSSETASTTSSRSAKAPRSSTKWRRVRTSSASSAGSFPRSTAWCSERSTRAWPASRAATSASTTTTSLPARAATSAIPEPISPHPTTPIRWKLTAGA